jgi:peptide/nickel transport system substrate-binding protein
VSDIPLISRSNGVLDPEPGLDPQLTYGSVGWELLRCCLLRTLFAYSGQPGREGGAEVRPDLATSWEVSDDGLTWSFRIREGIRYGPPLEDVEVTAADFVRALLREARTGGSGDFYTYSTYYSVIRGFDAYAEGEAQTISGLETPDEHTLVVRLDEPAGDLPDRFAMAATAPIPPDPYRPDASLGVAQGHDDDYGRFLVASGPYMIEGSGVLDLSVEPREREPLAGYVPPVVDENNDNVEPGSVALVRNPSWDPATDDIRPAYPDRIEIQVEAVGRAGYERLYERLAAEVDAGTLDHVVDNVTPVEQLERYQADPEYQDRLSIEPRNSVWYVWINVAVPPFDDLHVRRAVASAIDEEALVDELVKGIWASGPADPVPIAHVVPDGMEADLLSTYDPYEASLDGAKAEMRASAYDRDGDGVCDAPECEDVRALSLKFWIPRGATDLVAESLAGIGIELRVEPMTYAELAGPLFDETQRVPLSLGPGLGSDYLNPSTFIAPLFSSDAILGTGFNPTLVGASPAQLDEWGYDGTEVPSVDDRIARCMSMVGAEQLECWVGLDRYLMEDVVAAIPFVQPLSSHVVSARVESFSYDQFTGMLAYDRMALVPGSE